MGQPSRGAMASPLHGAGRGGVSRGGRGGAGRDGHRVSITCRACDRCWISSGFIRVDILCLEVGVTYVTLAEWVSAMRSHDDFLERSCE